MQSKRCKQVGEMLKEEISEILRTRLKDPRVGFVTLTDVKMSKDLRYAKIFFSVLDPREAPETLRVLKAAHGFIQAELAKRVRLRYLPVLCFELDTAWEKRMQIDRLLHDLTQQPETADETFHEENAPSA